MQISDERTDPVRCLLLRMADLVELRSNVFGLTLLQQLARNIDLDRESEQHLGEVVMQVPGDLKSFVRSFLGHRVRERTKDLFAVLQFYVSLFERLRSKEHLPRQEQWGHESG
jgi:hypothetical protein